MYQIVAAQSKYSEEEVRDRLSTVYPSWDIEGMNLSDRGWLVRLKKNAEFPFKEDDEEDSKDDAPEDSPEDSKEDSSDDDSEDSKDESDDDSKEDSLGDDDVIDAEEKKDLVSELHDLQAQLEKILKEVGDKASEVADDAQMKDDKIKEIADSVNEVAPKDEMLGDMAGLEDVGLGAELPGGAAKGGPPGAGGPPMPPRGPRPPAPKKRPPVPGGGINAFTKRKTEVVTHPGTDHAGARISMLTAARELEATDEWTNYEIMSMTQNVDGSFSAKLRLK